MTDLSEDSFTTEQEREKDRPQVELLYDASFGGTARWQRPIYDLRRGISPVAALCLVVRKAGEGGVTEDSHETSAEVSDEDAEQKKASHIAAALRFWQVRILADSNTERQKQKAAAEKKVLLFGPLAVHASEQGKGLGKALVERSIAEAKRMGYGGILISGVVAYYRPFGFRTLCVEGLDMPRPSPGHVLMGLELKPHFLFSAKGRVLPDKSKENKENKER